MSNEPISEQYRLTAKSWVRADAIASLLEETKSAQLSQLMLKQGDIPVSRAEMNVKGSEDWKKIIADMVHAREEANLLKVKVEWLRMRFNEQQSADATRRAEMKL